jgi:adenylate cyclase
MRASPHDPQTWQWTLWIGISQFHAKDFSAALDTMRQVMRLRPAHASPHLYTVASLGYLGRLDEARAAVDRAGAQFSDVVRRVRKGSPWTRPEDYAFTLEGLRLAGGETA